MPAQVREERERELEACEVELAEKQAAARESEFRNKIIGKYHHIRFFGKSSLGTRATSMCQSLIIQQNVKKLREM
jgi:hypothetical protein